MNREEKGGDTSSQMKRKQNTRRTYFSYSVFKVRRSSDHKKTEKLATKLTLKELLKVFSTGDSMPNYEFVKLQIEISSSPLGSLGQLWR